MLVVYDENAHTRLWCGPLISPAKLAE
jgi:hypothetical protein